MKNWICTCLFLFINALAFAQEGVHTRFKTDLVIVRSFEVLSGSLWKSKISISDGKSEIESIELRPTKPKNVDENLSVLAYVLNAIKKQGYTLTNTNSGGGNELGVYISNYIFEKEG
ncbi:hypothetical protein LAG90_02545 [Marinilongibacter aquaticus]|uniref:hypothetical protein n=1 Tax=Marinilongibacter aquaticus TaxID=2975157 RepID=UPI0021BD495B|nr:hypothetical protein [Marinilongibacter aquaticus]UBM59534.1 hypothetical protein LAG90_02545 [Marinilongibacter aquaticus]